jgi:deazaflavin-dependent oxidoreductase (nitroreductase family)
MAHKSAFRRAYTAVLRTPPGRWVAINAAARIDPTLMKLSRGHVGVGVSLPTVNLTTTGAKSGQERVATVLYFTEGEDVIMVASSFGRDRDPAWSFNLKANPEATLESHGRGGRYRAEEVVDEAERRRLWHLADLVYPGYADYRERTAKTGRVIPIFRLRPA